jgi:hypothetical protein
MNRNRWRYGSFGKRRPDAVGLEQLGVAGDASRGRGSRDWRRGMIVDDSQVATAS